MTTGQKIELLLAISFANLAAAFVNIIGLVLVHATDARPALLAKCLLIGVVDTLVWVAAFAGSRRMIS